MTEAQYSKKRFKSKAVRLLYKHVVPIYVRDISARSKNPSLESFEKLGSAREIHLKSILIYLFKVDKYLQDLITLPNIYMAVDRKKIKLLYGKKLDQEQYFMYHYDNIMIRLLTALDLCAKIGNVTYNLGIKEDKCNWYAFTIHRQIKGTPTEKALTSFADKLKTQKTYRHQKLHRSETDEENRFDKVVYFESINDLFDTPMDEETMETLEKMTSADLKAEIHNLNKIINMTVNNTYKFIDSLTPHIEGVINQH